MPNPTKFNLERKPQAIVMLAADASAPKGPHDWDFEWFDTDAGRSNYFETLSKWCKTDQAAFHDTCILNAEVLDTKTMTLGRVEVIFDADLVWAAEWKAKVEADPSLLVKAGRAAPKAGAAKVAKVKPKVKGRAQSAAAAVLAPTVPGEVGEVIAPAPKPKAVRRPKAAVVAEEAPVAAIPAKGAAALKARLAAKKQPVVAEVKDESGNADEAANAAAEIADGEATAEAKAEPMALTKGQRHNQIRRRVRAAKVMGFAVI